ncbi:restriction endonuclease subunit S [Ligilactobacillus salivarius]|uniref:restriction endonuclease subunit S n=2 Tax=Ligilactobacillus salivarius TaxID=1624 RepID=UPI0020233A42|nr:restriction endonuclease subunit S [Ligilactobacillus salivarius]URI12166.1 restriction endonuclease subunit S [Ligilactobacillus salivarius]
MAKEEKKAPKLRFNGYTNDWEHVKSKYLFENISLKGFQDLPVLSVTQDKGVVYRDNLDIDIKYDLSTLKNYKLVQPGDFIISLRSFQGGFETSYLTGITSPAYTIFNFIDNQDKDHAFWQYLFKRIDFINSLKRVTFGIRDGKAISFSQFGDVKVKYPSFDEQKHIATALTKLDNTIQLHERKCEELALIKKALLQKLFPKKDEFKPEVRYKNFSDAWEQRKVSELLEERTEKAPENKIYPLMAFIANKGVAPKGDRYDRAALVKDAKNKKYKRTKLGDFIYSSNNLETGSIGLNNYGNASISPVYSIFKPTGIANSDFIGRRFVRKDFINLMIRWRQGVVYGQWRIHEKDFLRIDVSVPSLKEQQKIGNFLSDLDSLITLHQRKLEKLKQLKKFLLQNMFI